MILHFTIRTSGAPPDRKFLVACPGIRASTSAQILVSQLPAKRCMISFVSVSGRVWLLVGLTSTLLLCEKIPAQTLLSSGQGPVHLVGSDLAVLEAQDVR